MSQPHGLGPDAPEQRERQRYWDAYYARLKARRHDPPSQFAVFALSHCDTEVIVDLGCGSGRDSLLFSRYGRQVVSLDASATAVQAVRGLIAESSAEAWWAAQADISQAGYFDALKAGPPVPIGAPATYYSRFLLHALSEGEERGFWNAVSHHAKAGDWVAIETRVAEDASRPKVTTPHYRRFAAADDICARATSVGFSIKYDFRGNGVAVWKSDDAYVLRLLLEKDEPTSPTHS